MLHVPYYTPLPMRMLAYPPPLYKEARKNCRGVRGRGALVDPKKDNIGEKC